VTDYLGCTLPKIYGRPSELDQLSVGVRLAGNFYALSDLLIICRMPYDGCPPDGKYPGDDSPVVWGQCGHAFHLQCIQKWIHSQTEQRCPMCRRPWEFKAAES
jgi:anaphase-promoting complex subunit 11